MTIEMIGFEEYRKHVKKELEVSHKENVKKEVQRAERKMQPFKTVNSFLDKTVHARNPIHIRKIGRPVIKIKTGKASQHIFSSFSGGQNKR